MSELTPDPSVGAATAGGVAVPTDGPLPRQRRLALGLFLAGIALYAIFGAVGGVLLPSQVAQLDPLHKVASLGVIAGIGAIFATFSNPLAGALSDRTRGRLGRRTPWLALGAVGSFLVLAALGRGLGLVWVAVWWCCAQVLLNCVAAPLIAIVADRTPRARRGMFSSVVGIATMLGLAGGTAGAAAFQRQPGIGYVVFGALLVVCTAALVLLDREPPASLEPLAGGLSPLRFLSGFAISPRRFPDFWWVFGARFALILGYVSVFGYQLYILRDYIHLSLDQTALAIALLSLIAVVTLMATAAVCGPLSDRLDRRRPFVIVATLVIAAAQLIPIVSPTVPAMELQTAIAGFGYGCYLAVDVSLVTLVLPRPEDSAKDLGIINIANAGPQTVAPFVAAAIIGTFGGYRALFAFAMASLIVAALAILPVKSVR